MDSMKKTRQKLHEVVNGTGTKAKGEIKKSSVRLEHYQKFFENGTYERCWESGTEGNYNMVDGQVNNLKKCRRGTDRKKVSTKSKTILKKKPKKKENL